MTEQEFAAIRERHRKVAEFPANPKEYHLGLPNSLGEGISVFVTTKHVGVTEHIQKMPDDVASLIRAVEERDAIIHDLQLDGAGSHERIRQAERGEVVGCLRYLLQRKKRQRKAVDLHDIETQVQGLEWRGEVIGLKAVAQLNGLKALVLRGLERGQS